ncbi:MAG: hypothetical protein ACLGH0_03840, partial [Thermoanaerobaculia bacterium]
QLAAPWPLKVAIDELVTGRGTRFELDRGDYSTLGVLAALVLGIAPWPFAFVELLGPDSLTASISFFGLLLLTRARAFFFGALLLSSTLLLRPEMAAVAPVPIAVALWSLRRPKFFVAAAIAFLLPVLTQYAYRTWSTGHAGTSLFGSLTIYNAGAFAWANSWIGTEHEAYDFVYALSRHRVMPLPERAFHDDAERTAIKQLQERARAEGYSADIDAQFAEIARRKKAEHPFSAVVLPRLWHAAHLWLNVETSDALLVALSNVPRIIRRPMLAALLLLKLALLILFLRNLATSHLATLFASFVIARTLLIGLVLNWMVHRYTLAAWLPLIVVALLGRGRAADESRVESSASDSRP